MLRYVIKLFGLMACTAGVAVHGFAGPFATVPGVDTPQGYLARMLIN